LGARGAALPKCFRDEVLPVREAVAEEERK
jgi:hypothetical protein